MSSKPHAAKTQNAARNFWAEHYWLRSRSSGINSEQLEASIDQNRWATGFLSDAACAYLVASSVLRDKDAAKSKVYAERAVSLIEQAVANGYNDYPHVQMDADKEQLVKRQANATVPLVRLGHQNDVWPLLKHSADESE